MSKFKIKDFIIPKNNEKYFYTIAEIEDFSYKQVQNMKANRTLWQNIKHKIGSNETAQDLYNETIDDFNKDMSNCEKDNYIEIAGLYIDYIRNLFVSSKIADYKINDLTTLLREKKAEYKFLCIDYVKQSFENPLVIQNWDPIIQALDVYKKENSKEKLIIENFKILKTVLNQTPSYFRPLIIEYNQELINQFKDKYKRINALDIEAIYAPYFNKIKETITDTFDELTKNFQAEIIKQKAKPNPSAIRLLELYRKYNQIEQDFSSFSEIYSKGKFKNEIDKISKLMESISQKNQIEKSAFSRIMELQNPIEIIIQSDKKVKEIDSYLDKLQYPYIEFIETINQLKKYRKNYLIAAQNNLRILTDPINKKFNNPPLELSKKFLNECWCAFDEVEKLEKKLKGIIFTIDVLESLNKKIKTTVENYIESFLASFDPNIQSVENHLSLLELCVEQYNKLSEYHKRKYCEQKVDTIKITQKDFYAKMEIVKENLVILKQKLDKQDFDNLTKTISTVKEIIDYFAENFIVAYPENQKIYSEVINSYYTLCDRNNMLKESLAYKETFILINPVNQFQYIFFKDNSVTIGRLLGEMKIIEKNKINIPWKRISRTHASFNFIDQTVTDMNSSNGIYSEISLQKMEFIDLKKVKEFNLAKDLTFEFEKKSNFFYFKFRNLDNHYPSNLISHRTLQQFCDEWNKKIFIKLQENSIIYLSKIDGKCYSEANDKINFVKIENIDNKYYFTDFKENIENELILKGDNKNISFHFLAI